MMQFLMNCIDPSAVTMLFIAVVCLIGYGFPGYQARNGYLWLLWLFIGILAAIAWVFIVGS